MSTRHQISVCFKKISESHSIAKRGEWRQTTSFDFITRCQENPKQVLLVISRVLQSVMLPRAKLALGPLAFRSAPDRVLIVSVASNLSPFCPSSCSDCSDCSCLSYRIAPSIDLLLVIFCMFASVFKCCGCINQHRKSARPADW